MILLALGLAGTARSADYTIRPQIDLEEFHDDNVLSAENELASWGTHISPSIFLLRKSETTDANLQVGFTRNELYNVSEVNGTDKQAALYVRHVLTPRLTVGARANYNFYASYSAFKEPTPSGTQLVLFDERPELTWSGASTDLTYSLDERTDLTGELEWNVWRYDHSQRRDLFDTDDGAFTLTLTRSLTPRDKAGLQGALSYSKEESSDSSFQEALVPLVGFPGAFVDGVASNFLQNRSQLATGMVFWQHAFTPRTNALLRGGMRFLHSEGELNTQTIDILNNYFNSTESNHDSGTGFIGGGTINHAYSDRGQVSLSYMHDTRTGTASSAGTASIDIDSFTASLGHKLSEHVTLSLSGTYLTYKNTSESKVAVTSGQLTTAADELRARQHYAEARLEWEARKNLLAYTSFNYYDVDQNRQPPFPQPNFRTEYARRIFMVGIRYYFDINREM